MSINSIRTFNEFAVAQRDVNFARDLLLVSAVSRHVLREGGRALVVGGFVRDTLIGICRGVQLDSKDLDVEVYGISFEKMVKILAIFGNVQIVGQSFKVAKLVSPYTGSLIDFSTPRRDSKTGVGHKDFDVVGDPFMSVEDAARRRDLTINSMAVNPLSGRLHDPFGGADDIEAGILRATDFELFADDPLRVLRVMQFAGRFGFSVDLATADLCRGIDLSSLSRERVGEEWLKLLLRSTRPSVGLEVARDLEVLRKLHPQLNDLVGVQQNSKYHPEGDVWQHTVSSVDAAARIVQDEGLNKADATVVMLGALCHDMGKAATTVYDDARGWISHGHETAGIEPARRFLNDLKMPKDVIAVVAKIVERHMYALSNGAPTATQVRRLSRKLAPANIRQWDLVSRSDSNGRGLEFCSDTPSGAYFRLAQQLAVVQSPPARLVTGKHLIDLGLVPGRQLGEVLGRLYDAQLRGEFADVASGLAYYQRISS
ncbi:MAG: HD domain-containing protein [Candidatus Woesebacteria bacterium]